MYIYIYIYIYIVVHGRGEFNKNNNKEQTKKKRGKHQPVLEQLNFSLQYHDTYFMLFAITNESMHRPGRSIHRTWF